METRRKTSPGRPSSYSPTLTKPLQSATRNSNVRLVRDRGSFSRTGTLTIFSTMRSTTSVTTAGPAAAAAAAASSASSTPSFLAMARGWATLQLSR